MESQLGGQAEACFTVGCGAVQMGQARGGLVESRIASIAASLKVWPQWGRTRG